MAAAPGELPLSGSSNAIAESDPGLRQVFENGIGFVAQNSQFATKSKQLQAFTSAYRFHIRSFEIETFGNLEPPLPGKWVSPSER